MNTFTIDTDEYYAMCYKLNMMPRPLKTLYIFLDFVLTNHHSKTKLKRAHLRECKSESKGFGRVGREGDFTPDREGVLLPRHFDKRLSVYHFHNFEP